MPSLQVVYSNIFFFIYYIIFFCESKVENCNKNICMKVYTKTNRCKFSIKITSICEKKKNISTRNLSLGPYVNVIIYFFIYNLAFSFKYRKDTRMIQNSISFFIHFCQKSEIFVYYTVTYFFWVDNKSNVKFYICSILYSILFQNF